MLDFLRRGVKSWVAKILLGLLIISFAVWGIGDIFTNQIGGSVAQVGETEVSADEFATTMLRQQRMITQQRRQVITLDDMRAAGLDRAALNGLVRDAAFAEELRTLDLAVPSVAVADTIRANPSFQDGQGAFSQFTYQTRLSQQGFNPAEFEELTRALLGQQILADAISPGTSAPPGAAETMAKWQGETRAISTLTLTPDTAPEPDAADDTALQAFFEADSDRFIEPERRWGSVLHVDLAAIAEEMAPTDEEVRAEYDANPDEFTVTATRDVDQIVFPDQAQAEAAAKRIADGAASYEEIAAERNIALEDLSLGTVTADDLPEATAAAVFALTEAGLTGPIETPFGFELLNVTGVEIGGTRPFDEVKDQLRLSMSLRSAQEELPKRTERIEDIRAGGASMEEIAAQLGVDLIAFNGLAANRTVAEDPIPPLVLDPRFMNEAMTALDQEEREIIALSDGSYALVWVDRIVESHLPEFDAIKDRVATAWELEERLTALDARATEIARTVGEETPFAEAVGEASEEISDRDAFSRLRPPADLSSDLVDALFAATEGDVVHGRNSTGDAVVLVHVRSVTPLDGEELARQVDTAETSLTNSVVQDQVEYFARALEERHGRVVNQGTIEQIFEQLTQMNAGPGY